MTQQDVSDIRVDEEAASLPEEVAHEAVAAASQANGVRTEPGLSLAAPIVSSSVAVAAGSRADLTGDGSGEARPPLADPDELLLAFLRGRDVECPRCGYNLRDLPRPECPECREGLLLTVGRKRIPFGPLVAAVAPGIFSGICAALLVPFMIMGAPPAPWILAECFGWFSLGCAIVLCRRRERFQRLTIGEQWIAAVGVWVVHVTAFFLLVSNV